MFYFLVYIWEKNYLRRQQDAFYFYCSEVPCKAVLLYKYVFMIKEYNAYIKPEKEKTWSKQFIINILREGCFHACIFNSIVVRWVISPAKCWRSLSFSSSFLLQLKMLSLLGSFNFLSQANWPHYTLAESGYWVNDIMQDKS